MRSRAYRRHQRARTIARHRRYVLEVQYRGWNEEAYFPKDIAQRHPADCGRPCGMCHLLPVFYRVEKKRERRESWEWEWTATEGWDPSASIAQSVEHSPRKRATLVRT